MWNIPCLLWHRVEPGARHWWKSWGRWSWETWWSLVPETRSSHNLSLWQIIPTPIFRKRVAHQNVVRSSVLPRFHITPILIALWCILEVLPLLNTTKVSSFKMHCSKCMCKPDVELSNALYPTIIEVYSDKRGKKCFQLKKLVISSKFTRSLQVLVTIFMYESTRLRIVSTWRSSWGSTDPNEFSFD